jgi:NADPH2:quinone reductase
MKAAVCKAFDGPDAVVLEEVEDPQPGPGEVIVRVGGAGLNFFDTLLVRDRYQFKPELPFSPCAEMAGVIENLGDGVTGFTVGDRVLAYLGWGCAREKVAVPVEQLVRVPDGVSDIVASGLSVTYGTAMHGLRDRGQVQPGETVAVLGASGGAGLAAVEISKRLGARVIAVASSKEKLAICEKHGADVLLNYASGDLKQDLKDLTDGRGVDVVYDCVGGPYTEPAVRAMAWGGRHLVIGFAAGEVPKIPLNLTLLKGCALIGVFWGSFIRRDPDGHRANVARVLEWVADGTLDPHVHGTYGLGDVAEAIKVIARREALGKIVIVP